MAITAAAVVLGILGGALVLSRDYVVEVFGRICVVSGMIFIAIALSILSAGCSSPTAPTQTLRLTWSAAPGCSPGSMPSPLPAGNPFVTLQLPGSDRMTAGWSGLTVVFRQFGQTYMVCEWKAV